MTTETLITFALAVLALGLKPGPGMMMVMSRTMSQGMSACLAFTSGFLLMTFVYLMLVMVGFYYTGLDIVFLGILIKSMAAIYLIWMGAKGLQSVELTYGDAPPPEESLWETFVGAIILTASNPLVIVFYAGILPSIINVNNIGFSEIAVITSIVLILEGGLVMAYCLPLALFRKKIPIKFLKGLRVFSSIMMICIGLYIGYTAIASQDIVSIF